MCIVFTLEEQRLRFREQWHSVDVDVKDTSTPQKLGSLEDKSTSLLEHQGPAIPRPADLAEPTRHREAIMNGLVYGHTTPRLTTEEVKRRVFQEELQRINQLCGWDFSLKARDQ